MSEIGRIVIAMMIFTSLAMATFVHGSTVQKLSFARLAEESDVIVQGQVADVKSRQARDPGLISTIVAVSVERQFKGPEVSSVTIEQPGGTLGDLALGIPGTPEFAVGENVILFLKRQRGGTFATAGGKQGKFTARVQPGGDTTLVEDFAHRSEDLNSFLERLTSTLKR